MTPPHSTPCLMHHSVRYDFQGVSYIILPVHLPTHLPAHMTAHQPVLTHLTPSRELLNRLAHQIHAE